MTIAVSSPVTDGVITALRTLPNPSGGTIRVGDADAPERPIPTPKTFYPYCTVRTLLIRSEGSLTDPKECALHRVEVTSVGLDRAGTEWLDDQVRNVLLNPGLEIDGHAVVWSTDVGGQSPRPDRDVTPHVFFAVAFVNLMVSPAASGS